MKKYFVLTSLLTLTACFGGGGSSVTSGTPNNIVIPDAPTTKLVDSDSGLSMVDINATRTAKYTQALSIVDSLQQQNSNTNYNEIAIVRSSALKSGLSATAGTENIPTPEEVDAAYATMKNILVDNTFDGHTQKDILISLALTGMTAEQIKETLNWTDENDNSNNIDAFVEKINQGDDEIQAIVANAKDIYKDFGREFTLTLQDAKFYNNSNDTNWYKFVFDDSGKITHLQEQDGHTYAKGKNGVFENDIVGKRYSFEHTGIANNHEQHINIDMEYNNTDLPANESDIRAALIQTAAQQYGLLEAELNEITSWINNAPIIEFGAECTSASGCIELGNANYKEKIRIETGGADLGLKYADFGLKHNEMDIRKGDSELFGSGLENYTYKEHNGFVGGYEDKMATPESGMVFKGNSYVGLTRKLSDAQIEEIMNKGGEFPYPENNYYTGTATLTVGGDKDSLIQNLVADFSKQGWYEVTVDNIPVNGKGGAFAFDDKGNQIDEKWQVHPTIHDGKMENSNIKYYGPASGDATEAVGFVQYIEDKISDGDWTFKADITFGGKKK